MPGNVVVVRPVLGRALLLAVLAGGIPAVSRADVIYTKDGKQYHGVIQRRDQMGLSVQLVDGRQKYFRSDEIARVDDANKDVQIYTAAASSLDIQREGGLGYYYLAAWCEKHGWRNTAVDIYKVALADSESAPLAAQALLRLNGMEVRSLSENGLVAGLYSPFFDKESLQRLMEVRRAVLEKEKGLSKSAIGAFKTIANLISRRHFSGAYTNWKKLKDSLDPDTKAYLEDCLRSFTGYDLKRLNAELIFLTSKGKDPWACPKCKGTGKVKCSKCNGAGYIPCPKCKGRGVTIKKMVTSSGVRTIQQKCSRCGGKGYLPCPVCKRYRQYYHSVYVRGRTGSVKMSVSGFVPCPLCKGSGRSPDAPEEAVTFSALRTDQMKARFREMEKYLYSSFLAEGEQWGNRSVPLRRQPRPSADPKTVACIFYRYKWFTPERIEQMKAMRRYSKPEVDETYLKRYLAEIRPMAVDLWRKAARPLSGGEPEKALSAAEYFKYLSDAVAGDILEKRLVFTTTFRKGAAFDAMEGPGEFLYFRQDSHGVSRSVRGGIDGAFLSEDFRGFLESAEEVTLYYSISGCSRRSVSKGDGLVEVDYKFKIVPFVAVAGGAGGTSIYVRTGREETGP